VESGVCENTIWVMENIFSFVLVVLTAGLLVITLIYVRHTKAQAEEVRKMADVLERDYIARNTPVIDFTIGSSLTSDYSEVTLHIYNYSQVPSKLTEVEFSGPYKDDPAKVCRIIRPAEVLLGPGRTEHKISIGRHELMISDDPKYEKLNTYALLRNIHGKFIISYSDNRGGTLSKQKEYGF